MSGLQRILVVDDEKCRIWSSFNLFGDRARNIVVVEGPSLIDFNNEDFKKMAQSCGLPDTCVEAGGEEEIAKVLREEQYNVILLDGNLGLELEGQYFDGRVIARRLRSGVYGSVNQNTRILSTSSQGTRIMPQAEGCFVLEYADRFRDYQLERARKLLE